MAQTYLNPNDYEKEIEYLLQQLDVDHILLVCGKYLRKLPICNWIEKLWSNPKFIITCFDEFSPNPKYDEIQKGVKIFQENHCDFIFAVGGGSAMDVAKSIKWYGAEERKSQIPILAAPTTAGTGSEATPFAVLYKNETKYSIEDDCLLPDYVLLDSNNLICLPIYQKKVTICDALAHAMESYWSVHATRESKKLATNAIEIILNDIDAYLQGDDACYEDVMRASNLAGKAIGIAKTTAAHAMSYKLTSLLEIPHGHAVMLCLPEVWEFMQTKLETCKNKAEWEPLEETLNLLAGHFGKANQKDAIVFLKQLRSQLNLGRPKKIENSWLDLLVSSVNNQRLENFPIALNKEELKEIYQKILF